MILINKNTFLLILIVIVSITRTSELLSQTNKETVYYNEKIISQTSKDSILYCKDINIDTAIFNAKKYFESSIFHNKPDDIIKSSSLLSNLFHTQNNYADELNTLIKSIEYLVEDKYLIQRADFLLQMSEASRAARKFESGMEYLDEAEVIYLRYNEKLKLSNVYNRKAAILLVPVMGGKPCTFSAEL